MSENESVKISEVMKNPVVSHMKKNVKADVVSLDLKTLSFAALL